MSAVIRSRSSDGDEDEEADGGRAHGAGREQAERRSSKKTENESFSGNRKCKSGLRNNICRLIFPTAELWREEALRRLLEGLWEGGGERVLATA